MANWEGCETLGLGEYGLVLTESRGVSFLHAASSACKTQVECYKYK